MSPWKARTERFKSTPEIKATEKNAITMPPIDFFGICPPASFINNAANIG